MLVLPASLTHRDAPDAARMLAQTLRSQPAADATDAAVAIDASALKQFDSSALAVLLECQRQAVALGRRVELKHAPAQLRQLARVYGVEALFGGASSAEAAASRPAV